MGVSLRVSPVIDCPGCTSPLAQLLTKDVFRIHDIPFDIVSNVHFMHMERIMFSTG